jgi:hypothetical protein
MPIRLHSYYFVAIVVALLDVLEYACVGSSLSPRPINESESALIGIGFAARLVHEERIQNVLAFL